MIYFILISVVGSGGSLAMFNTGTDDQSGLCWSMCGEARRQKEKSGSILYYFRKFGIVDYVSSSFLDFLLNSLETNSVGEQCYSCTPGVIRGYYICNTSH